METLSAELFLRVVEYVNQDGSTRPSKHLARFCQTSRTLHRVATPALYAHIKQPSHVFYSLLKTLCINPGLRQHIIRLQEMHIDEDGSELPGWYSDDDSDPDSLIKGLSEELGMDPTDLLACYHDGEDIWPTTCALIAPQLKHAKLVLHHTRLRQSFLLLEHIARHTVVGSDSNVRAFDELQSLHLKPHSPIEHIDVAGTFTLFLLPRLEALHLGGWDSIWGPCPPDADQKSVHGQAWTWPVKASPISDMSLCNIDPHVPVCAMIHACKKLVKFKSILCCKISGDWYARVAVALQEHRDTLRELYMGEKNDFVSEAEHAERLHSLQLMPCLGRIRIPWWTLVGHSASARLREILPPNLEELVTELDCVPNEDIEAAFIDLYQYCVDERFAALRGIHLLWRLNKIPPTVVFDVAKVKDLFGSIRIQFDVTFFCRDTLRPAPIVLRRYEQIFTAYVKCDRKDLGRNVGFQRKHFLQASTQCKTPHEHEELLSAYPC